VQVWYLYALIMKLPNFWNHLKPSEAYT